ncbi:MAG: homoserine dehydrogenase [Elusimicrobia bacterium CG11_big_fil_rev_8_21_14_0_20_64_6]|nr:MAG: homoserine dehydrogenase [Elusimicrobia bacterium CG11_big_fil_rev_8_21_14_0_20_64_6]
MNVLNVAVAGLGTVGRETVRLLRARRAEFKERLGAELRLVAVADRGAIREARALGLPSSITRYRDPLDMARRAEADLFVELLGGLEAPRRFSLTTLRRGKALVTANKRLLAHAWADIMGAARDNGARVAFEGSVAGGIPVLRALELSFSGDRVLGVDGILNGTTNYILSQGEEGVTPEAALREAQRLGFAEKDPTMDLSGHDAAQKLSVLAGLVTGGWLKPGAFPVSGIEPVSARDLTFARERLGMAARLVASLRFSGNTEAPAVSAVVAPTLVPLSHPLAALRLQYNALLVHTASAGDLMFYGQGAGAGPTSSAVLADILVLSRDILGGLPPAAMAARKLILTSPDDTISSYYLRLEVFDRPGALARIADALADAGVSIAAIHQEQVAGGRSVPVMIVTHPAARGRFEKARKRILSLASVKPAHCAMRMMA